MTENKICPYMSKPDATPDTYGNPRVAAVPCQKERCAAWEKHNPILDMLVLTESGRAAINPWGESV